MLQLQMWMQLTALMLLKILLLIIQIIIMVLLIIMLIMICLVGRRVQILDNETNEKPHELSTSGDPHPLN